MLQDRNGDGVVDFVNARIVLGEKPSAADVSAAADVAARFGFETMAMNLPLLSGPEAAESRGSGSSAGDTTAFIIGSDGARRMGATLPAATRTLRPGDGMVVTTTARGEPAVMVLGGDAAGTMAAAELLAGRLPRVWDPKGPTLANVVDEVKSVLTGAASPRRAYRFLACQCEQGRTRSASSTCQSAHRAWPMRQKLLWCSDD